VNYTDSNLLTLLSECRGKFRPELATVTITLQEHCRLVKTVDEHD